MSAAAPAQPTPQDATTAVLAAFDRYDAVGMNAAHSNEKQDAFILSLIHHPAFPSKVNDLVVECGNSAYQPTLDRFIAGDDVPLAEARQAWRKTWLPMCATSGFYDALFPVVRAINLKLPKDRRLRVLVGEPSERGMSRDALIASVITTEVFAKHRKALLLFGVQHLFHPAAYEKDYPGRTLVIDTHNGFAAFFDLQRGHELEAQMKSWPVPSIVTMKGSWLGDLDLPYFLWPFPKRLAGQSITGFVDAYLYLGPGESLTYEPTPDAILNDDAYMAVLTTRFSINPAALRTRNLERALFTAADRAEARQFAPGADCVGTYAKDANRPPAVVIDFKRGVLAARVGSSTTWTPLTAGDRPLSYRAGGTTFEFESVAGTVRRLTLDPGESTGKTILVRR